MCNSEHCLDVLGFANPAQLAALNGKGPSYGVFFPF